MKKNIEEIKEKNMSKEKKKTIIFTVILAVIALALIVCFVFMELRQNGIIGSIESAEIMKGFNENYNSKNRKVIYYARTGCGACELQKPVLETVAEDYDIEYFSIDSIELSRTQRNEIIKKLEIEGSTPAIVIVENGKVIAEHTGYLEGTKLIKFFKENEIVPEDAVYSKEKYITYINYEEYKSLIRNDKTNIIVIGAASCGNCRTIKPALNSIGEDYNLTINYVDMDDFTQDEKQKFFESLEKIEYNDPEFLEDGSFGTPTTLIVENGKVQSYTIGAKTYSQLVREFTKVDLIEE